MYAPSVAVNAVAGFDESPLLLLSVSWLFNVAMTASTQCNMLAAVFKAPCLWCAFHDKSQGRYWVARVLVGLLAEPQSLETANVQKKLLGG